METEEIRINLSPEYEDFSVIGFLKGCPAWFFVTVLIFGGIFLQIFLPEKFIYINPNVLGYHLPLNISTVSIFFGVFSVAILSPRAGIDFCRKFWPFWWIFVVVFYASILIGIMNRVELFEERIKEYNFLGICTDEYKIEDTREIDFVINRKEHKNSKSKHVTITYELNLSFVFKDFRYDITDYKEGTLAKIYELYNSEIPITAKNKYMLYSYLNSNSGKLSYKDKEAVRKIFGVIR